MTFGADGDAAIAETLAHLEVLDPQAAADARSALSWLVGDRGLEGLSRYAVQQFCWYELPFKWLVPTTVRVEIIISLAQFFELAGLRRYGEVCQSLITAGILRAWDESPGAGYEAYRKASRASGIEPPHLSELRWGALMGVEEYSAFWSTAMALEVAVDAGELVPGAPGWRRRQEDVARRHLNRPRPELLGASHLQSVWTMRLADWIDGPGTLPASRARAQVLAPVANALLHRVDAPRDLRRTQAPLVWLLDQIGDHDDGLTLTRAGNLPQALVRQSLHRFPSWAGAAAVAGAEAEVRGVAEVPRLAALHHLARDARLVRRGGSRVTLTKRGRAVRSEPELLWRAVAESVAAHRDFGAAVTEVVFALLLVEPLVDLAAIIPEATVVLTESGWYQGASGEPVPADAVEDAVDRFVLLATTLGWVRDRGRARTRRTGMLRLTATGRATGLAALRGRALAPRQAG
jgi:hypothetical protein